MKGLYTENYKILIEEIKEGTDQWKDIPYSWIGTTAIIKMSLLLKAACLLLSSLCQSFPFKYSVFFLETTLSLHM